MPSPLIVTFVTEDYIAVTANWLRAMDALRLDAPIRVITLDDASRSAFPAARTLHAPLSASDLGALWVHRVAVIRALLAEGHDVIHSDSDALWVGDPLPLIAACDADMVFSQGTVWPPDVHARHGLVLCCGLFRLRATPTVADFMATVESRLALDRDDQVSLNRLLDEAGLRWTLREPYRIPFRDTEIVASREIIQAAAGNHPSVAVLPHHRFPRLVERLDPDVLVAHPLCGKTRTEKQATLSALGLWR